MIYFFVNGNLKYVEKIIFILLVMFFSIGNILKCIFFIYLNKLMFYLFLICYD